jgi:hypothetical protein
MPTLDELPGSEASLSAREAIKAEIPMAPQKPTVGAWLSDLQGRLLACESREAVEAAILSDDVCKAHALCHLSLPSAVRRNQHILR